jgi:hypothetical protein
MKQETKEYIDNEVNNLATVLRKEVSDIAQGIHERIAAVQRDLGAVKSHTDDHCRLGAHNADVANAVFEDLDRQPRRARHPGRDLLGEPAARRQARRHERALRPGFRLGPTTRSPRCSRASSAAPAPAASRPGGPFGS